MTDKALNIRNRLFLLGLACFGGVSVMNADALSEGRAAFMKYDFELAGEKYARYAASLKKSPNTPGEQMLEKYKRQLEIAENSLDNVQKIEIIDRIDVPAEDFLKYIKLPSHGGKLLPPDAAILKKRHNESDFAFSTEAGDLIMWSEMTEDCNEHIMESERLLDGSWEKPILVGSVLNEGGNTRNPFLLTDGLTLYYSGDGEGSMGGYDIFVATKDPATGEFRQPVGVGFPFNSPFNEYLMAIDEDNGIGWWVTDRNELDGQVSVYIFKTNEVRKNYVVDEEEDIISLARIDDIKTTQNPDTDYGKILKEIDKRHSLVNAQETAEFIFPMPGGKVARRLSDFSSASARRNMQQYLQAAAEHDSEIKKLSDLRKQYYKADKKKGSATTLKNQIMELESKTDWQADRLKKMRNTIITAESNN